MSDFLEGKRLHFPRFFFLSNDELLAILSETRDPTRVQPHLRKCFRNINSLEFDAAQCICAMRSQEGERVALLHTIKPSDVDNMAEKWMLLLENEMRASLRDAIRQSLEAYPTKKREEWALQWPQQVALTVASITWTASMTQALASRSLRALEAVDTALSLQHESLLELVRGSHTAVEYLTLNSLITADVHARDVTSSLLKRRVTDVMDFDFQSQMRVFWENESVFVRMLNSTLEYAFEYIGNSSRLVITPLTERCFRTLLSAIQLNFGGSVEGGSVTGKTETVKELAKCLAKHCIVFNCSESLDYRATAKFFKGLVGCGAWLCLDEFNRMDLHVLSVVAQQLLTIQQALASSDIARVVVEGTLLPLVREQSVCVYPPAAP